MNELIILPPLRATLSASGKFVLTQKYLEGAAALAKHWPGSVTSLVELTEQISTDFDHVEADTKLFGNHVERRPKTNAEVMERIGRASVVLGFLARRDAILAPLCKTAGLPLVFVTEYTPVTEAQIIEAGTSNPLLRWRRKIWLKRTEVLRRKAASLSVGLQCSGKPIYDHYADVQDNRLLFFDNRLSKDDLLTDDACRAKGEVVLSGRPLRLVYGGRFIAMKGVMDLPDVAAVLKKAGVPFQLDIYGDGPQKSALASKIVAHGLEDVVKLCAPLDFRTWWVKMLKEKMDLFVCCHPQGDPSSTYPEVMSCGVPIVGYNNQAFAGIVDQSGVGWPTPIGKPSVLAAKIAELSLDRRAIAQASLKALDFARKTAFDTTYKARTEHLIDAAGLY